MAYGCARQPCPGLGCGWNGLRHDERFGGFRRGRSWFHPGARNASPRLQQGDVAGADPRQRLSCHDHPAERARGAVGIAGADSRGRPSDIGSISRPVACGSIRRLHHTARTCRSYGRAGDVRDEIFVGRANPRRYLDQPRSHRHLLGVGDVPRDCHTVGGGSGRSDRRARGDGDLSPCELGRDLQVALRYRQNHGYDFPHHHQCLRLQPNSRLYRNDVEDRRLCFGICGVSR